ncbi:hypothetical protein TNCV_2160721 [Trichonephila clavipes]|nr:hypothetical protein TNCV_2160721 [Trichonephila clavipes]
MGTLPSSRRGKCVTFFGGVRGTPRNSSACKQQGSHGPREDILSADFRPIRKADCVFEKRILSRIHEVNRLPEHSSACTANFSHSLHTNFITDFGLRRPFDKLPRIGCELQAEEFLGVPLTPPKRVTHFPRLEEGNVPINTSWYGMFLGISRVLGELWTAGRYPSADFRPIRKADCVSRKKIEIILNTKDMHDYLTELGSTESKHLVCRLGSLQPRQFVKGSLQTKIGDKICVRE